MRLFYNLFLMLLFSAGLSVAGNYSIDKAHSTIGFNVTHMIISKVDGKFTDYDVKLHFDENNLDDFSVDVTAKIKSIDTDNAKRDSHLISSDFFDASNYPDMTFKSTQVIKSNEGYVASGVLTIRGISKNIDLPFTVSGPVQDPWGNTRIGIKAATIINRQDFGVNWNTVMDNGGFVVDDEVEIIINSEFVKS